jgi:hypothetical protein
MAGHNPSYRLVTVADRLHRLHDAKRIVRVYDYVDSNVLMLARMYARRLKGYGLIGYTVRDHRDRHDLDRSIEN